ncbi:hypothetical protein [Enterococcus mediterraneensis]|uniref:hypothetical protein n=1 Tax=Enterococcus mediterraneensis TaxID=2364791 RepID=UPI000F057550|nr:hypothetical protein [Enterococcus mediterraneensis]
MTKILTVDLNKKSAEEVLEELAEKIIAEDFDLVCLEGVFQQAEASPGFVDGSYCSTGNEAMIREDNTALRLVELLQIQDSEYYWTWTNDLEAVENLETGRALLSKEPILPKELLVDAASSASSQQKLLTGLTEANGKMLQLLIGDFSQEKADSFDQQKLSSFLEEKKYPVLLTGTFSDLEAAAISKDLTLQAVSYPINVQGMEDTAKRKMYEEIAFLTSLEVESHQLALLAEVSDLPLYGKIVITK